MRSIGTWLIRVQKAVVVLEKARATRVRELGPAHADTLVTLVHLALAQ